jgi:transaldolase
MELEPDYLRGVIDRVIEETEDNDVAAMRVYQIATERVIRGFTPIYEESEGVHGYVTMQGDPRLDTDSEAIVEEALDFQQLGSNFMAKIPVTKAGIEAIETLVEKSIPICATEIFSIAQTIEMCEVYQRAATRSGNNPPFYVTHITGIFDQYWQGVVKKENIDVSPDWQAQAGCIIARKEYRLLKERGYPGILLGGGARGLHHFTEMVGGDLAVTLNWSTMQELVDTDGPVASRIDAEAPQSAIDELCEKLPNFSRAYYEDGLDVDEFEDFGPVVFFRAMFLNGYSRLLDEIADRRLVRAGQK